MRKRSIKQLVFLLIAQATVAQAATPGFYMGLMAGSATNTGDEVMAQRSDIPALTPVSPKSTQFGSRIFMGYQISNYAGIEWGLNYFSAINYDTKDVDTCTGATARVRNFDIAAKGTMPFANIFDVYGKAGVALTYINTSGALSPNLNAACGQSTYETKFKPTVSVGASYNLSQRWVTDISWNRIMVGGFVKNVDLYGIGISYHFVEQYCGQFLCDN